MRGRAQLWVLGDRRAGYLRRVRFKHGTGGVLWPLRAPELPRAARGHGERAHTIP